MKRLSKVQQQWTFDISINFFQVYIKSKKTNNNYVTSSPRKSLQKIDTADTAIYIENTCGQTVGFWSKGKWKVIFFIVPHIV